MADKLTTSKSLAGETDAEAEAAADKPPEISEAAVEAANALAGGVGDATDWNHTEGEADPLVDPYEAPHSGHDPAPAEEEPTAKPKS